MEEPPFDLAAAKAYFEQMGIADLLPAESVENLDAALSALSENYLDLAQLASPDVSPDVYYEWIVRLLKIFDNFTEPPAIIEDPVKFSVCWAWWVILNRQAKVICHLHEGGLAGDAAPLVRSMLEYSLWCVALSHDDGPLLATIMRTSDEEDKKMIKALNEGLSQIPVEITSLIRDIPRVEGEGSSTKSFIAVCRSLGVADTIVPLWRFLSSLSHPTASTVYLLTEPGAEGFKIKKTPELPGLRSDSFAKQAVAVSVQSLLWAGFAIDRLIGSDPMHLELQAIADEAQVTALTPQSPPGGSASTSAP
jgi:Family of unknown function (DUF5677)